MIYGYARCSTTEDKQDINRQKRDWQNQSLKYLLIKYFRFRNQMNPTSFLEAAPYQAQS